MKTKLTLLLLAVLLQGCSTLALVDVPEVGERNAGCGYTCTYADRNFAIAQNIILWGLMYYTVDQIREKSENSDE